MICEDGKMYGEEYTLVTVADYVLKHTPGNTVSNLSSTRALRDVTRKYGQEYYASAVGEVNVTTKMKRSRCRYRWRSETVGNLSGQPLWT